MPWPGFFRSSLDVMEGTLKPPLPTSQRHYCRISSMAAFFEAAVHGASEMQRPTGSGSCKERFSRCRTGTRSRCISFAKCLHLQQKSKVEVRVYCRPTKVNCGGWSVWICAQFSLGSRASHDSKDTIQLLRDENRASAHNRFRSPEQSCSNTNRTRTAQI